MQLRKSERKKAKIKMAVQGSSGSGKTYSSLLLAQGLTNGDFSKVAVIDSENGSADLYAHLGQYNVLSLKPPFTPENYIKAIEVCEKAGMEAIIIDSISQSWEELLDYHSSLAGNSFTNWAKVTPRQNAFIDKILQIDAHIIATMRTKQDYVLNQKDGKFIPEKVGLKAIQRNDLDYEFTLVFEIDIKHFAISSKDRTGLFMGKPEFIINSNTGKKILDWCNSGTNLQDARERIKTTRTVEELKVLYNQYSNWRELLEYDFKLQKDTINSNELLLNPKTFSTNGSANYNN
ncbi:AAA family ATPase [Flavobacterium sp. KACC 22763]|uniref:AAA family ATPase n=1 Tax=Flavobacterium sp. KACC 22763 TaxID=3025668 RepID=UPI002365322D|nr:AAA family ATPase [Flavobacterium sp. KACC 22763]WDF63179.1 AAA family ATPase [Flavobacterium sp. KACC 22763]